MLIIGNIMIAKLELSLPEFKPHLNNEQQFLSATVLALTENSTVYAVHVREKETDRRMAIKIYRQDAAPPSLLFHLLNHPHKHLVNILRIKNTRPASVCMELCSHNLRESLQIQQQQMLPPEEATRVMREMCQGLLELKSLRLMHGDLKPENILVGS